MIDRGMLENAARDYNGDKYSEEFYTYHLKVLRDAEDISESVSRAVEYLFFWKLGKVRPYQTPRSSQSKFSDSKGHQYYIIRTPKNNNKVIGKALEKGRLKTAISFRNGTVNYDKIKYCADYLTSSTIILPAFYIHIWLPAEYPIIDEKVWKVFQDEKGQSVSLNTKPKSWGDFEAYTSFFRKLVEDTGLDRRIVDQGLWILGDRLKKRIRAEKKYEKIKGAREVKENLNRAPIPDDVLDRACACVIADPKVDNIPFKCRGIKITIELIKTTMEILNAEPTKTLPQNCRNAVKKKTPDGLDRRIKDSLNINLRTANIISDVLEQAGIVEIVKVTNSRTGNIVKGAKLLQEWSW